jgi:hypothetical protein
MLLASGVALLGLISAVWVGIVTYAPVKPIPTVQPISPVFVSPIPSSIPTPKPQVKGITTQTVKKVDSDPPVHCNVNANCGGGTTPLKKSECDNSICCQIGDKWIFYKDKNKCIADQGGRPSTQQGNFTSPGVANTKTLCKFSGSGYSFDFGELTYDECTKKTEAYWASVGSSTQVVPVLTTTSNAELRDECLGEVQSKYQTEMSKIRNQARALGSSTSTSEYLLKLELEREKQNCESRYPL